MVLFLEFVYQKKMVLVLFLFFCFVAFGGLAGLLLVSVEIPGVVMVDDTQKET